MVPGRIFKITPLHIDTVFAFMILNQSIYSLFYCYSDRIAVSPCAKPCDPRVLYCLLDNISRLRLVGEYADFECFVSIIGIEHIADVHFACVRDMSSTTL